MAILQISGFETGAANSEVSGGAITGSGLSFDSVIKRTGSWSLKCAAVSGTASSLALSATLQPFNRFYVRFTALPATTARRFFGATGAGNVNLKIRSDGKVEFYNNVTLIGTSTTALTDTTAWYLIEIRSSDGASVSVLDIDGVSQVTGSPSSWTTGGTFGATLDTVADTFTCYYDDWASGNSAIGAGAVVLLVPTADNAGGTGWTLGTGTALGGNGFAAVDNEPPVGVADLAVGSDPKQIRNASANANTSYDATMTTYTVAGVPAGAIVNFLDPMVWTAAPVTTSAKAGTVGVVSNPTIANVALGAGGTAGAFWSGVTGGTFPTGWKLSHGTLTYAPSVVFATAPVMRITQVTSSTRIAVVCAMAIYVDFTAALPPPSLVTPRSRPS